MADVMHVRDLVRQFPQRATQVRPTDRRNLLHVAASFQTQDEGTDERLRTIMFILVNDPPQLEPGEPGADVHAVDAEGSTPLGLLLMQPAQNITHARRQFLEHQL